MKISDVIEGGKVTEIGGDGYINTETQAFFTDETKVQDALKTALNNHDALVETLQTINELSMSGADVESYLDETVVPLLEKLEGES